MEVYEEGMQHISVEYSVERDIKKCYGRERSVHKTEI